MKTCTVNDGCTPSGRIRKGLCTKHYMRLYTKGSTDLPRQSDQERFWEKVRKTDDCWIWDGAKVKGGYGQCWFGNQTQYAHRVSYEIAVGPIPAGLEVDHLCRNPSCVNPDHLEPVTPVVNFERSSCPPSMNAKKTHCLRGHELAGENLKRYSDGRRECRICALNNQRARAKRLREAS